MLVVNEVDLILVRGELCFDDEYTASEAVFQGSVQTFTASNREACVTELSKLTKGVRRVAGEPSVGKSTYLPKKLTELTGKFVVVVCPNGLLAANGAFSLNTVYQGNEATCLSNIASHYGDGQVVYVAADYLSLQFMDGYSFSELVSHVILDECHVDDGYMGAMRTLLMRVANKIPVLFVSGTHTGTLNGKVYDGIKQHGFEEYDAGKHGDVATAVYCESNAAAFQASKAHGGLWLSENSSYASLTKVYEGLRMQRGVVFLGPKLSEGLNLPVMRVIDCKKRLMFYYDSRNDVGFLKRETVPNDSRAQRVKRGGTVETTTAHS